MKKNRETAKFAGRFGFILIVLSVVVLLILWRYISLMLLSAPGTATSQDLRVIERGPILDRNGRVLAIQTQLSSVTVWKPELDDSEAAISILSDILDMSFEAIRDIFSSGRSFSYIKRKVSERENKAITDAKSEGFLSGIYLQKEYDRTYPEQELASHVLGIVGVDNEGLEGLELVLNDLLSPPLIGDANSYGNQVFLTLDINVQYTTEKLAQKTFESNQAEAVMLLVMDAKTGDILGYASQPTFNPNSYNSFPSNNRLNRPAKSAYEPGSVFKVFSLASFINLGGIGPNSRFVCNGFYEHPDIAEPIKCLGVHGQVGPFDIIKFSCNAGAAYASEQVESEEFYAQLRLFGFGAETDLPFPGESNGLLNSTPYWSTRTKPTLAFGQEISTSAVQIITAATVFTNQGMLLEPHIIKKVVTPDGRVANTYDRKVIRRAISSDAAKTMLSMMEGATQPGGTAVLAAVDGVRVAAKTGTAQLYNRETGTYSEDEVVASCLSILPVDDPQLLIYVMIEKPKAGEIYGGRIAAPVVSELASELIPYLGIPKDSDVVIHHTGAIRIIEAPELRIDDALPDFTGLSKRQLLPLFDQKIVQVRIQGEGWVVQQTPAPGTRIRKDMLIVLELK